MITLADLHALQGAITSIVDNEDHPWLEKRDRVIQFMDSDLAALEEFVGWFEDYEFPEE